MRNAEIATDRRSSELLPRTAPRYDGPDRRGQHLYAQLWSLRRHPLRLAPAPWPQGTFRINPES